LRTDPTVCLWLQGMPLAIIDGSPATPAIYYVQTDHIDTPRVVLDRQGRQRWSWVAEPFGNSAPVTNPLGLGALTLNLRMPGQYFDSESGLSYNWHRSYDAGVGRYTQSDPIGLEGGINTYSYAESDPVDKSDPSGLIVGPILRVGAAAMAICMKNARCRKAVQEAIEKCKNIECRFERHDAHHNFPGHGYCEHYSLRCYEKGAKGRPPIFEAQWPFPGRCVGQKPGGPLPPWLPPSGP
jgi:RHS repeat-associated protein